MSSFEDSVVSGVRGTTRRVCTARGDIRSVDADGEGGGTSIDEEEVAVAISIVVGVVGVVAVGVVAVVTVVEEGEGERPDVENVGRGTGAKLDAFISQPGVDMVRYDLPVLGFVLVCHVNPSKLKRDVAPVGLAARVGLVARVGLAARTGLIARFVPRGLEITDALPRASSFIFFELRARVKASGLGRTEAHPLLVSSFAFCLPSSRIGLFERRKAGPAVEALSRFERPKVLMERCIFWAWRAPVLP